MKEKEIQNMKKLFKQSINCCIFTEILKYLCTKLFYILSNGLILNIYLDTKNKSIMTQDSVYTAMLLFSFELREMSDINV